MWWCWSTGPKTLPYFDQGGLIGSTSLWLCYRLVLSPHLSIMVSDIMNSRLWIRFCFSFLFFPFFDCYETRHLALAALYTRQKQLTTWRFPFRLSTLRIPAWSATLDDFFLCPTASFWCPPEFAGLAEARLPISSWIDEPTGDSHSLGLGGCYCCCT